MTTEVHVKAHPGRTAVGIPLQVVVLAIDTYDGQTRVVEQARLGADESYIAYATDTRTIQVMEVVEGAEVQVARQEASEAPIVVEGRFVQAKAPGTGDIREALLDNPKVA